MNVVERYGQKLDGAVKCVKSTDEDKAITEVACVSETADNVKESILSNDSGKREWTGDHFIDCGFDY